MGVSVRSPNGQQVPGLGPEAFTIEHEGAAVAHDGRFRVLQSRNATLEAPVVEGQAPPVVADPLAYDVYFAIDLSQSMATPLRDSKGRESSRLAWALRIVDLLVRPNKQGSYTLFDQGDRVYLSGFSSDLHTDFLSGATANRETITKALVRLNEFQPSVGPAALYKGILHNLALVQNQAAQYSDPAQKRQAVVITLTDSWNGTDPRTGKVLKGCTENDALTDEVRAAIVRTREATQGNFKFYMLALGKVGELGDYKLADVAGKRCKIGEMEPHVLDGRALSAIGDPQLGLGGVQWSEDPAELANFVGRQFEALKTAYEVTYGVPPTSPKPGSWKVSVAVGEGRCEDSEEKRSSFVHHARQSAARATSPFEVAMFLACALLLIFFIPRAVENAMGNEPEPTKTGTHKRRKKA